MIKPNTDFYEYVLNKYNIKPEELLFLDDKEENIDIANRIGINTIHVDKNMDIYNSIDKFLENKKH